MLGPEYDLPCCLGLQLLEQIAQSACLLLVSASASALVSILLGTYTDAALGRRWGMQVLDVTRGEVDAAG